MFSILFLPSSPVLICIILFGLTKGLEIKKVSEEKIIATESGYSYNSKSYNFKRKNIFVKVESHGFEGYCTHTEILQMILLLYNTNPDEIDLDNSNIKNIPFKSIQKFKKYIGTADEIELNLSNYFGGVFENKIKAN